MDFTLSKEQEMARTLFREMAENEIKPLAAEIDEDERFPKEALALFRKYKMMGIPYSKEYGGAGCDTLTYEIALEEICKVCATTGTMLSAHISLGTWPIVKFGTPEQKAKYLPKLCSGEFFGRFCSDRAGRRHRCFRPADKGCAGG